MKILNYFKKSANEVEPIKKIIEQPKVVCDICYGVGLVDHEDAEFRTRKHWCQCKKPKEIDESNRFWWHYDMLSKNGFALMSNPVKDGCDKKLPIPENIFEPTIGIIYYNDNGFIGVSFYTKKKMFMSSDIYWSHESFFNHKDIMNHGNLYLVLLNKILENGISTVNFK